MSAALNDVDSFHPERALNGAKKRSEAIAIERRDRNPAAGGSAARPLARREEVALIEHQQPRLLAELELVQDLGDRGYLLLLIFVVGVVFTLGLLAARDAMRPAPAELTQEDIDNAVLYTMENKSLPSRAAKAAEAVMGSVVRVRGYDEFDEPGGNDSFASFVVCAGPSAGRDSRSPRYSFFCSLIGAP